MPNTSAVGEAPGCDADLPAGGRASPAFTPWLRAVPVVGAMQRRDVPEGLDAALPVFAADAKRLATRDAFRCLSCLRGEP